MAEFPALPLWTDALIGDTYHLTPAEFGAYMRLLICQWRSKGCKLPVDHAYLVRVIGDPKNGHRILPKILPFFTIQEDSDVSGGRVYLQLRLLDEYEYVSRQKAKSSSGGKAKALKMRHMKAAQQPAQSLPELCLTPAPTPTPTPNKERVAQPAEGKGKPRKQETAIADDWKPTAESIEGAKKLGYSESATRREAERFRTKAKAKDWRYVRWDQAFNNWMQNQAKYDGKEEPVSDQAAINGHTYQAMPHTPEYRAWQAHYVDIGRKSMVSLLRQREDENRPWTFESRWPPGHKGAAA